MAKKAKVVKEKSIEDRIWDSANKLRGNLTASECASHAWLFVGTSE